eukprot:scaffold40973_cov241-Skeletonema_marinoi.AAC.2
MCCMYVRLHKRQKQLPSTSSLLAVWKEVHVHKQDSHLTLIECPGNHTVTTCVLRIATAATMPMLPAEDVANIWLPLVAAVVSAHMIE